MYKQVVEAIPGDDLEGLKAAKMSLRCHTYNNDIGD